MRLKTKLVYVILIGIAITSISIGTVYAALSQSAGSGTNFSGATTMYALKVNPSVPSDIAQIQITFPSGFSFPTPRVFNIQNIGSGHIAALNSTTIAYTVDTPVSTPAGTQIVLLVGGIVNTNTLGSGQNVIFDTVNPSNGVIETGTFPLNIVSGIQDITDTGGKVGIGTTTPSQKLEVNGNIQVDGNIVEGAAQPLNITPASGQSICIGAC